MNRYLEDWHKQLEDLEIHVDLGEEEIIEAFEKQKASFRDFLEKSKESVAELKDEGDSAWQSLQTKLDELQVQLALGKAETRDAYEEQKEKLDQALHAAQVEADSVAGKVDSQYASIASEFKTKSEGFETQLDLFRLHYALGKAEAREKWDEKKGELRETLAELRRKIDQDKETAEEKWDEFSGEMTEAFGHLKTALKGLFS